MLLPDHRSPPQSTHVAVWPCVSLTRALSLTGAPGGDGHSPEVGPEETESTALGAPAHGHGGPGLLLARPPGGDAPSRLTTEEEAADERGDAPALRQHAVLLR